LLFFVSHRYCASAAEKSAPKLMLRSVSRTEADPPPRFRSWFSVEERDQEPRREI